MRSSCRFASKAQRETSRGVRDSLSVEFIKRVTKLERSQRDVPSIERKSLWLIDFILNEILASLV
ncbi:MAG: hypothetical protein KBF19_04620, partial [Negativicutes bacterium]|nr:hypothetical protein [Negativicutes bacterium]